MTRLSVNINKIATLRNSRGENNPNILEVAILCEKYGAQGITVHPRPDERHIKRQDVYDLKKIIKTEFNIEGYPSKNFMSMVTEVLPEQVTLVPDASDALTSNQGWDVKKHSSLLKDVIAKLQAYNIRTSIFVETNLHNLDAAKETGTDRIELYTEPYAKQFSFNREIAIQTFAKAAIKAHELKIGVNAGHDLNLSNLRFFAENIPELLEVSIGHALIVDALYFGLKKTINMYLEQFI